MIPSQRKSVVLRPPPGPLAWLFPELLRMEDATTPSVTCCDDAWVEELRASGVERVIVREQPRAEAFATVLRQKLRTTNIEVVRSISPDGAGYETTLQRGVDRVPGGPPLLRLDPDASVIATLDRAIDAARGGASDERPIPYLQTRRIPETTSQVETRLPLAYFGLLPGDLYPRDLRERWRTLLRLLWPARYSLFLQLENAALGGFDLYRDALFGRSAQPAPSRSVGKRARVFAVCGIDGSGKSTHVETLRADLSARGLDVAVHKIYRHGVFHDTVTDLSRRSADDKNLHLWRMERTAKLFDSLKVFRGKIEADLKRRDVLIFDRYVQTHFAAGAGRSHVDPYARELLAVFPPADRWFLLDLPAADAMARIGERDARTVDENLYMLDRFRVMLLRFARRDGVPILDARAPFAQNQAMIRDVVESAL